MLMVSITDAEKIKFCPDKMECTFFVFPWPLSGLVYSLSRDTRKFYCRQWNFCKLSFKEMHENSIAEIITFVKLTYIECLWWITDSVKTKFCCVKKECPFFVFFLFFFFVCFFFLFLVWLFIVYLFLKFWYINQ